MVLVSQGDPAGGVKPEEELSNTVPDTVRSRFPWLFSLYLLTQAVTVPVWWWWKLQ